MALLAGAGPNTGSHRANSWATMLTGILRGLTTEEVARMKNEMEMLKGELL